MALLQELVLPLPRRFLLLRHPLQLRHLLQLCLPLPLPLLPRQLLLFCRLMRQPRLPKRRMAHQNLPLHHHR